jgi:hypothetical protein
MRETLQLMGRWQAPVRLCPPKPSGHDKPWRQSSIGRNRARFYRGLVEIRVGTDPLRKVVTALTATVEVHDQPALDEVVDLPEFSPAVINFEVILPALKPSLNHHFGFLSNNLQA